jgi:hypothetical protein
MKNKIPKIPQEQIFNKGEILKYTGRGFLGFDRNIREMEFVEYYGLTEALVKYNSKSLPMIVSKYDLERIK